MAEYLTTDTDLQSIANAIRAKGGTSSPLEYPDDFVDAIGGFSNLPDPVTIEHGGTGATTVNGARANLGLDKVETVTGADVTIVAVSNTRYMCGTLSTLSFTPSATGICDVMFTSGSSKTILSLPNTVIMPDGFEVAANTVYEINILDGVYGVVASWPT